MAPLHQGAAHPAALCLLSLARALVLAAALWHLQLQQGCLHSAPQHL
jgi:hypothetical protein